VVSWFHGWLGLRRQSIQSGAARVAPEQRSGATDSALDLLRRGVGAMSSDVFDRAFRSAVTGGDGARPGCGLAPASIPADAPPVDWTRAPGHLLRREALYHWLERWYAETDLETLGGVGEYARRPWLRVGIGAVQCHLNANTSRAGVADYLALARAEGPRLPWAVVTGRSGVINEIAVGADRVRIRGFQLFTDSVFRQPGLIGGAREETRRRGTAPKSGIFAA